MGLIGELDPEDALQRAIAEGARLGLDFSPFEFVAIGRDRPPRRPAIDRPAQECCIAVIREVDLETLGLAPPCGERGVGVEDFDIGENLLREGARDFGDDVAWSFRDRGPTKPKRAEIDRPRREATNPTAERASGFAER